MARFTNLVLCSSLALGVIAPSLITTEARACGGLFCNSATPVNQAAERIIFAKNDDGTVTAVIEIMYEGPANEFAWVLPVPPGDTKVGVSSKEALDRLNQQSNPQYFLNQMFDESCNDRGFAGGVGATPPSGPGGVATNADDGILVVAEGNAGPYNYTQIMADPALADPAAAAIEWLETNGYDVTKLGPKLLGAYLEDGMNLIAFKLQKGKDAGSVRPVMLNYKSKRPIIPIKPTAVAANEDMGVKVWLLGDSRAVSSNYPDLVLNESLIDWFTPNNTYNDVVIAAANETAAGQGFVTEQSGPAAQFAQVIYQDFEGQQWDQLRTGQFGSLQEFFQQTRSFAGYDGYNDLMLDPAVLPLRVGATHEQFLSCMECYFQEDVPVRNEAYPETPYPGMTDPINTLDVKAFLAKFYTLIIEPLEKTRALFEDHATVTRFYTTLSPDEMTLDPEFVFNPELPDISNVHQADQILSCNFGNTWTVNLPQGMVIRGEGQTWPVTLAEDSLPVNLRIVQLSTKGEGEVLTDNSKKIANVLVDLDVGEATPALTDPSKEPTTSGGDNGSTTNGVDDAEAGSDGGCSVTSAPGADWGLLPALGLVLPLLRRRRESRARL